MIKLVHFLSRQKPLVIIFLSLPVLAAFFLGRFKFTVVPESPHARFTVLFSVPHRQAEEIAKRVTEPAEKVFNGLPGLLSMESNTLDHKAEVSLAFKEGVSGENAYLYLQEKLDRIKLMVPRDVESVAVDRVLSAVAPTLDVKLESPQSLGKIARTLAPFRAFIQKSEPDIMAGGSGSTRMTFKVDPEKLAREGVALSEIVESLKLTGVSTSLGSQSGILFGIGRAFESVEEIGSTVVAARGHRPILLSDVGEVRLETPKLVDSVSLWFDPQVLSESKVVKALKDAYPGVSTERTYLRRKFVQCLGPLLGLFLIVGLQLYFFPMVFGKRLKLSSIAIFDGLISVHFLFWRGVVGGDLSVIDLHALMLTLIVGTTLWIVLFARIRTYFLPDMAFHKLPKSIEQANLFAIGELLPTFFIFGLALWLFDLPVLLTQVNLPSRILLHSFFTVGLPIVFGMLVLMPVLTSYEWIRDSQTVSGREIAWVSDRRVTRFGLATVLCMSLLGFGLLRFFPIGLSERAGSRFTTELDELRGYKSHLPYLLSLNEGGRSEVSDNLTVTKKNTFQAYNLWEFTPSGMRYLPELNLVSFSSSVGQMEDKSSFGFLRESSVDQVPLEFGGLSIPGEEIGSLVFSSKIKEKPGKQLRALASSSLLIAPSSILRSRMLRADEVEGKFSFWNTSLRRVPAGDVVPTQGTSFVLEQMSRFNSTHWMSLTFFFLVAALYLNSFVRAIVLVLYGTGVASGVLLLYSVLPGSFHSDSLWLLYLAPALALLGYLVISRVIDIERSRGHDRDLCMNEVRVQFAPAVVQALGFSVVGLIGMGILDHIPGLPSFGLWREAVIGGLIAGFGVWHLFKYLLPVLYLRSEEYVDQAAYWIFMRPLVRKWMRKMRA